MKPKTTKSENTIAKTAPAADRPLVGPAQGSVTKIRQQLAQQHQIQLSDTTLRRYLTKLGYRPSQAKSAFPVQDSKSSPAEQWSKPWPRAYGESLADYLSKQAGRRR